MPCVLRLAEELPRWTRRASGTFSGTWWVVPAGWTIAARSMIFRRERGHARVECALEEDRSQGDLSPRGRRGVRPRETNRDRPAADWAAGTARDGWSRRLPWPCGSKSM